MKAMTPHDLLCNHPLLVGFPSEHVRELSRYAIVKTYAAGAVVIRQGSAGDGVYGVLSGRLVIVFETAEGRDLIISLKTPGELFGEFAWIDGSPRTASVVAREVSSVFFLTRHTLLPFVYRHPELPLRMNTHVTALMRRGQVRMADVSFLGTPQRLAKTLVALAGDGTAVTLSQRELSSILGVSREIVNRQLVSWQASGFMKLARGRIILLDDGAMRRIADTGEARRLHE